MPRPTPNQRKMLQAVSLWIEDAKTRADGPELLEKKAAYVEGLIAELCGDRADLKGLTTWDLQDAEYALRTAALGIREARARRVVVPVAQGRAA